MPIEINEQEFKSYLTKTFSQNGLSSLLSIERTGKFLALTVRMLEENEKYNLTAITEPKKIILNHYADCATLSSRIKKGATLIDVGCGAGFPTLPLAILRDDIKIVAMDSTEKRVNYVRETARLLGLSNVTAVAMRAEDGAKLSEYREKFDYATARAVAELRVLAELCLPYVKVGGKLLAMKGKNAEFELTAAKKAIATIGGRGAVCDMITLKADGEEPLTHPIISVDKKEKTPAAYPRPYAQISKKPL
ncbi:MAG: 16S rRNA (guanine(527)-N(7))-methyltransferase RsmG [Clostridia bacterium]|nr:16S rRNA (guanine(527)-N(7))-methyltransferase RsmG [Clostridia bacterium]